ncbi:MAG: elongation factor G [Chloroflexi bacterium]|nr:elongation factor G [Chloroflexota bacterium]
MKNYKTEAIRNTVLIGHSGSGKTSLCEAMLFNAGAASRLGKVDAGTTISDYDPAEIKRKISINLSVLSFEWKDHKINIIDTPGYTDFVGEVIAGLSAADTAIVVVDAAGGVEVGTELTWQYADKESLPRIVFVNKIDRENADFNKVVNQIRSMFGLKCVPVQIPIGSQADFKGVVDLIKMKAVIDNKEEDIPAALAGEINSNRDMLMEGLAETNDELLAKFLEGVKFSDEEIVKALRDGISSGKVIPILVGSALINKAVVQLMDMINDYVPSPINIGTVTATNKLTQKEEEIKAEPSGVLAVQIFKTTADPYVGRLNYFRVYSGTIHSDSHVWNVNKEHAERIGQLLMIKGKEQTPTTEFIAGDIGGIAKLVETGVGDTICKQEHPVMLKQIEFPNPVYSVAVYPKTKADLDKMGSSISKLTEEDPTLRVRKDADTNETIVSGMGDTHIDVIIEKVHRKFGVDLSIEIPKIPYKETITQKVQAEYKHKKQTGGHGQYGHVLIELEPLARNSGFEFTETVVGGSVPRNFIPAVEKGVLEGLHDGVVAGYPITDMRINLYDGSSHPVDSSEMAFKIAAVQALKKGMAQANPVLLEPIMNVKITVPDSFMGDVISDLNSKRARVMGMNPEGGKITVDAQAPLSEMLKYSASLRSISQARGTFTLEFSHYEEVPVHITQKIAEKYKKDKEEAKEK